MNTTTRLSPYQAKLAHELKARVKELTARYAVDEIIEEIVRQQPRFEITVTATGKKK
jgi:hypothetical protein